MNTTSRSYRMGARQDRVDENRERIMQAMLELFLETPYDQMTLDAIAERAGTTRQTIIRQFGSKDELARAAGEWRGEQIAAVHRTPATPHTAVIQLVERYERFGDLNAKLAELEGRFDFADAGLRRGRSRHRGWIEQTWSEVLSDLDRSTRRTTVDALYAATDVMTWKLLRRDFGRSRAATEAAIDLLVAGVLASVDGRAPHPRS